jgi:hypothetical protein
MNINRPVDIENEIRLALASYLNAYNRPLPENFSLPNILIKNAGGNSTDTIDSFIVSLEARAKYDAEAYEYLTTAIGLLEAQANAQVGALRSVKVNSLASWGSDPARPDLKLATATVIVTAHRAKITIPES